MPPLNSPKNILVRMPNWLGDLVMATPVLKDLRHQWPQARITAMCQGNLGSVLEFDPHLDHILNYKKPKKWIDQVYNQEAINQLKEKQYDLGILLTNSLSSASLFWLGRIKQRLGYQDAARRLFLTLPVSYSKEKDRQHLVKTYKELLTPLGIAPSDTVPTLYISEQEKALIKANLKSFGIQTQHLLIGINPGAAYGSAKCWLPDRFKKLTEQLLTHPLVRILYFGDQNGSSLVHEICQSLPPDRVFNLAGKTTLRELVAYIKNCDIFLTNDSGPMHIASAVETPLIALFGSTSDVATGPYKGGKVIHKHVSCSPCFLRECPIDHKCMKAISVEEVYQSINEKMEINEK